MPKTSEYIKNLTLKKYKKYIVRVEQIKIKCVLVQDTDWLFIFKELDELSENYKMKLCISKVDYYLNAAIIQCAC